MDDDPRRTRVSHTHVLQAYVEQVARLLREVLGDRLVGVWLLGSRSPGPPGGERSRPSRCRT
jgi:hypothetical protein